MLVTVWSWQIMGRNERATQDSRGPGTAQGCSAGGRSGGDRRGMPHTRVRSQGLREEGPRPCPPVASPGGWCRPASSWKEWRPLPCTNVRFRLAALVTSAEFTDPFWTWLSLPLPSTPNSLTGQVTGRVICSSDPGVETWKQADSFAV